jgi:phenylpropionate dioxygenase-like ring-hydroxylating dioxygenase large terminal subunit
MHDHWKVEGLRGEWWLSARLPVNWKLAEEAFMEAYHVLQTHPQFIPRGGSGDKKLKFVTGSSASRAAQRNASGTVDSKAFIEMQIQYMRIVSEGMAGMTHEKDVKIAEGLRDLELPPDPGDAASEWRRQLNDAVVNANKELGIDIPDLNEIDRLGLASEVNYCFPHFFILPNYSSASSYRFRPISANETLFEIWSLTRYAEGVEPPRLTTPEISPPDDPRWPLIPKQDLTNMMSHQVGVQSPGITELRLSQQVEGLIGNYHRVIDLYLTGADWQRIVEGLTKVNGPISVPVQESLMDA